MELRHLRYVIAVADERHFGRAAARLGIRQPPLSQQIQAVERELGVPLFERSSRVVTLTPAGEAFLPYAREAVSQAERAVSEAQRAGLGRTGRLAIGFVGSSARRMLPSVLPPFGARYPEVELELSEYPTVEQLTRLREGRLDLGFVRPPLPNPADTLSPADALSLAAVSRERLVAVLPRSHAMAASRAVPLPRLASDPFVLFPRPAGPGLYDIVLGCCQQAGFSPRITRTATEMHTIVRLVAAGFGVSLVPASVAEEHDRVVFRPVTPPSPTIELALVWRTDDDRPTVRNFRDLVLSRSEKSDASPASAWHGGQS